MSAVTAKVVAVADASRAAKSAAVADVPTAATTASVADTRARLVGGQFASATEVALFDESRFVGVVPIERLLSPADLVRIGDLAEEAVVAPPESDLEAAARATARRGGRSVAVVDDEGRFLGLVPSACLLQILELEQALQSRDGQVVTGWQRDRPR